MGVTTKRLLISFGTVLGCMFFALPTLAASDYYANADTGNDANSCLSADEACLTIAGAQDKMTQRDNASNITLHLAGTFTEQVMFDDSDVVAPNTLDGLRITATDPDAMPTINGDGGTTALHITDIHSVTVDHLHLTNARIGLYVAGDYIESVNEISVHDNTIYDIASTDDGGAAMGGMYIYYAKDLEILDNTVDGVQLTLTNGDNYDPMYGIAVGNSLNATIKNNTVNDVSMVNDIAADVTSHQGLVYGISTSSTSNTVVRNNTVTNISITDTTTVNDSTLYTTAYGISVNGGFDTLLRGNDVQTVTSTATATGTGVSTRATMYGIDVNGVQRHSDGKNSIRGNTVTGMTMNATAKTINNYMYGMTVTAVEKLMLRNNIITTGTGNASTTESDGSIASVLYGMSLATLTQGTVRNNIVNGMTSSVTSSDDSSTLTPIIYGLNFSTSSNLSIFNNTVSDFSVAADNNDTNDFYDSLRTYGIYFNQGSNNVIRNNSIHDFVLDYTSAGEGGNVYIYDYGIYTYRAENTTVQKNTYRDITSSANLTDPTGDSNAYLYSYGLYLTDASGITAQGNTLKNISHTANSNTDCYAAATLYGIYVLNSPNSQISNNTIKKYTQTTSAGRGSTAMYGVEVSRTPDMLMSDNTIQSINGTHTGGAHSATTYGIYVLGSNPLYINANTLRNNSLTGATDTYMYGIYFNDDASKNYLINNIVLGADETDSEYDYGIYFKDSATNNVTLYHNTIAHWGKVVSVLGGTNYLLKNNILAARGADSHALEVDSNQIDIDDITSDYNMLYNETFADQIVYDLGDAAAISYADWKQLYKHDRKSVNKKPKIKSNGKLKKVSKAINRGTKNYGLSKKSLAYQLLSTDVYSGNRPVDSQGRVDIGADEFAKKTR